MDAAEQFAEQILDAIESGCDLWMWDQYVEGPHWLECARKLLIERRAACSDPEETAFFNRVIQFLEKDRR